MKDTLIGIVLGDGYLEPHGRGVRLQVIHSARYKAYVEWKHRELQPLQPSPLHYQANRGYPYWRFVTRCHPVLADLRAIFYEGRRKRIPATIDTLLTSPKSLAVWFMDDGTCDKRQGSIKLETQCFTTEELERLCEALRRNFGLEARIHQSLKRRAHWLYIPVSQARAFTQIVEPYIVPVMRCKLPFPVTTEGATPEMGVLP
jgi:recombination protein RecA